MTLTYFNVSSFECRGAIWAHRYFLRLIVDLFLFEKKPHFPGRQSISASQGAVDPNRKVDLHEAKWICVTLILHSLQKTYHRFFPLLKSISGKLRKTSPNNRADLHPQALMKAQWLTIWAPCCLISKNLHTGLFTFEQQQQIGKMLKSKKVITRYVCYVNISCVYIVSPPTRPAIPHLEFPFWAYYEYHLNKTVGSHCRSLNRDKSRSVPK